MKVIHGTSTEELEKSIHQATTQKESEAYKACPVCGSICFADMDTCYGCLHKFGSELPVSDDKPSISAQTSFAPNTPAQDPFRDALQMEPQAQIVISDNEQTGRTTPPTSTVNSGHSNISRHVCTRENGDAFEITVTVRML